jgi:hypothetical protein
MTTFQDLQAEHETLLNRHEAPADPTQFWADVQTFIDRVRNDAQYISAPRERDQLRAILRFWASYVFDKTGSYPDTTLRPFADAKPPTPQPNEEPMADWKPGWRTYLLAGLILLMLGGMFVWARNTPVAPTSTGRPSPAIVQPGKPVQSQPLTLSWYVVTAGPSPFNPNVWVARLGLSAAGGNDAYIFWVNGQRLPEVSNNQFTVESQGCQPVSQFIGVTSGGQSAMQELVIHPPEPNSCTK